MRDSSHANWRRPLLEAAFISIFILGLFFYWYGQANRHVIFLYGHTTVGIPRAEPFDEMTSSRYWMYGLVAAGAVMTLYGAANYCWGRVAVGADSASPLRPGGRCGGWQPSRWPWASRPSR